LLVWDKDTERFLVLLPCTCVLQPRLVHLYQNCLLLACPLGLCQFKITLFAPLHWAHQPHSNFRFPSLSLFLLCVCVCLSLVCDACPRILLHLFWVYNPHMMENMQFLAIWAWLTSLKMMFSSSIHLLVNGWVKFCCV
jgi:hypothetical protein